MCVVLTWRDRKVTQLNPDILAARGLEEHMQVSLIFAIIVSFMLFTVFTLAMYIISKNLWFTIHVDS